MGFKFNEDKIKMSPKDELEVYLLYKQDKSAKDIQERVLRPDGTDWSISKIRQLIAKFKKGYSPQISGDQAYDKLMGIDLEADLKDFDAEKSMSKSFKMATRLLEKALEDAEAGYEIIDESKRQIPIKTIMDTIEKAGRFWSLQRKTEKDAGKSGKQVQIDYKEMAKIFIKAKKDNVDYDAKGHMKAVIELINSDEDLPEMKSVDQEFDE